MTPHVLGYEVELAGQISEVSAEYPDVELEARPMGPNWLLRCSGRAKSIEGVATSLSSTTVLRYQSRLGEDLTVVLPVAGAVERFLQDAAASGGIVLPPLRWRRGLLRVRFLSRDGRPPSSLASRYPSARLELKRRVRADQVSQELDSPGMLMPRLTPRQAELIRAAVRAGYYEVPRRSTVRDLAREVGIARSTAEEHLREGESILVRALAPLVRLGTLEEDFDAEAASGQALHLYARFSNELGVYVQMAVRNERIAGVSLTSKPPTADHRANHPYLARILQHIATGEDDLVDVPVELRVSPFEKSVLEEIRRIPVGKTRTYLELARRLGRPQAARAVGNACASNPVPIVVPCHRVVPSTGGVGRYSGGGGSRTKAKLLEREGAELE